MPKNNYLLNTHKIKDAEFSARPSINPIANFFYQIFVMFKKIVKTFIRRLKNKIRLFKLRRKIIKWVKENICLSECGFTIIDFALLLFKEFYEEDIRSNIVDWYSCERDAEVKNKMDEIYFYIAGLRPLYKQIENINFELAGKNSNFDFVPVKEDNKTFYEMDIKYNEEVGKEQIEKWSNIGFEYERKIYEEDEKYAKMILDISSRLWI